MHLLQMVQLLCRSTWSSIEATLLLECQLEIIRVCHICWLITVEEIIVDYVNSSSSLNSLTSLSSCGWYCLPVVAVRGWAIALNKPELAGKRPKRRRRKEGSSLWSVIRRLCFSQKVVYSFAADRPTPPPEGLPPAISVRTDARFSLLSKDSKNHNSTPCTSIHAPYELTPTDSGL